MKKFEIKNGILKKYEGNDAYVTVPEGVTAIGSGAFKHRSCIVSVVLPEGLKSIGIECFEPKGAFYIFPDIRKFGLSSEEFCSRLLYEYRCAIVPGTAFGDSGEGFARISYAYSVKHIEEALSRMEAFVKKLKS